MTVKAVVFHRENRIYIRFRKLCKFRIVFLGTDLLYLVLKADLADGISVHIIALHSYIYADTNNRCRHDANGPLKTPF